MTPSENDHVKILFKNGVTYSGIVLSWSKDEAVLRDFHSKDISIIHNPHIKALIIKIVRETPEEAKQIFIDKPLELDEPERDPGLRGKRLADLYIAKAEAERERFRQKMNSFDNTGAQEVNYAIPTSLQKPTFEHSEDQNYSDDSEGNQLFSGGEWFKD